MKEYEALKAILAAMEGDVLKFSEKGNAAAGTRVRKALQDLKRAAQDMRGAVQAAKKSE